MKLFPILLELEDESVGGVLRVLKALKGVAKVHVDIDLDPDKAGRKAKPAEPAQPREPKDPNRPPPKDIIIRYLLKKGIVHLDVLKAELAKYGYKDHTASTAMTPMRREGITESAGSGAHKLTDKFVKSLEHHTNGAPLPALPPPRKGVAGKTGKRRRRRTDDGLSSTQVMLELCAKPVKRIAIAEALVAKGFSAKTLNGLVGKVHGEGWISIPQPGVYQITERGTAHLKAISAPHA